MQSTPNQETQGQTREKKEENMKITLPPTGGLPQRPALDSTGFLTLNVRQPEMSRYFIF
uniref:Uncharacterized protein n=1 Tax=Anguilla anguilla TaxID=7936 RepID=A0A0E9TBL7_ANGAN